MIVKATVKDLIQFTIAAILITGMLVGCGAAAMPKKGAFASTARITEVTVVKAADETAF